jgi:hypothetical protein
MLAERVLPYLRFRQQTETKPTFNKKERTKRKRKKKPSHSAKTCRVSKGNTMPGSRYGSVTVSVVLVSVKSHLAWAPRSPPERLVNLTSIPDLSTVTTKMEKSKKKSRIYVPQKERFSATCLETRIIP